VKYTLIKYNDLYSTLTYIYYFNEIPVEIDRVLILFEMTK